VALPCFIRRFYLPFFSFSKIKQLVANSDIIHLMSHWTFLNVLVYFFARWQKKPYVVCLAGSLPILGRLKLIKKIFNLVIGNRMIRNLKIGVACAPIEISYFEKFGVKNELISVISNGICLEDYLAKDDNAFKQAYGLPNVPFILFVGRLNPIKGPDMLLRAFCAVKDQFLHHLVFAGPDGGMLSELEVIVRNENVGDRVHFLGHVGGVHKSRAYNAADILVIPSRLEPLPIVLLEAGATSTPVLITDQCAFNQIEEIGGGEVVPATIEGLKQGLIKILGQQPHELGSMGEKWYRYTSEHFAWDRIVYQYIKLYENILRDDQ
jgi:glycosyltransferase involved in cell wall biosynthesis